MKNLNMVVLIGRLTADPELKTTANGKQLARCSVATNYSWKGSDGEWQEGVDFHNIIAWAKVAEHLAENMKKGEMVCVKGKLQVNKWEDKDGQSRRTVEVLAQNVYAADSEEGKECIDMYIAADEQKDG